VRVLFIAALLHLVAFLFVVVHMKKAASRKGQSALRLVALHLTSGEIATSYIV